MLYDFFAMINETTSEVEVYDDAGHLRTTRKIPGSLRAEWEEGNMSAGEVISTLLCDHPVYGPAFR